MTYIDGKPVEYNSQFSRIKYLVDKTNNLFVEWNHVDGFEGPNIGNLVKFGCNNTNDL